MLLKDADVLYRKHQEVSAQLEQKYNETRLARERAASLKERATEMYTSTRSKVDRLTGKGFTLHTCGGHSWWDDIAETVTGFRDDLHSIRDRVFVVFLWLLWRLIVSDLVMPNGSVFSRAGNKTRFLEKFFLGF